MIFRDGDLVRADAQTSDGNQTGQDGIGFYETFRTARGRPHLWAYHDRRLRQACAKAALPMSDRCLWRDEVRLGKVVRRLLESTGAEDAVFRYALMPGRTEAGECGAVHESLVSRPLPPAAPAEGATLRILNTRRNRAEWVPRPKQLDCPNVMQGRRELLARATQPSDEGLFLDDGGCVVETTHQNVGWVRAGCLYYPDPSTGCVAGTCLAWLLDSGVRTAPRRAPVDELLQAEAILVFNSVRGVTPIASVCDDNEEPILRTVSSATHPLVRRMEQLWRDELQRSADA